MSLDAQVDAYYDKLSRREIRSLIFHLLYAVEAFEYDVSVESIVDGFNRGLKFDIPLDSEAVTIAQAVIDLRQQLDKDIEPLLDNWRLERIGVCTKLILRLSVWELSNTEIPSSIVINEAIELAKCFSEKDAYRFVNGILDEVCKKLGKEDSKNSEDNEDEESKIKPKKGKGKEEKEEKK